MWRAAVCGMCTNTSSPAWSSDTLNARHPIPGPPPELSPAATSLTVSAFCAGGGLGEPAQGAEEGEVQVFPPPGLGGRNGAHRGLALPTCSMMFRGVPSSPTRTPMLIIGRDSSLERPTRPRRVRPICFRNEEGEGAQHKATWNATPADPAQQPRPSAPAGSQMSTSRPARSSCKGHGLGPTSA